MDSKHIIFLVLFITGLVLSASGQNSRWIDYENGLIENYKQCMDADYRLRYDSLAPQLKIKLHQIFSKEGSFGYGFDSLARYVRIVTSANGKLRVISYDERTGGSRHDMAALLIISNDGRINAQWIDSNFEDQLEEEPNYGTTDEIIFKLEEIIINQTTHYLCFGWGTYGGGHHHNSILVFKLEEGQVVWTPEIIPESYHKIFAARRDKIELEYDALEQTISFNEFKHQNDLDGFVQPTGKKIFLKFVNGKFLERPDP